MPEQALSDVKVLDLTWYIAGPYCTKLLADYGADVVKIERPGEGDPARRIGPFQGDKPDPERSGLFLYLNTNKKSITLNLKTGAGVRLFKELAREVDVVVESFSPGTMARLGLDHETLEKVNPRLVMTSISNFGQTGPYRDYEATHLTQCALGGWSYQIGEGNREPLQGAGWATHYLAGLFGAIGTAIALYYSRETGIGQHIDLSTAEAIIPILTCCPTVYHYLKLARRRRGNVIFMGYGFVARCKDGYLGANAYTFTQWEQFLHWMDAPELVEKFSTALGREYIRTHAEEITERLAPWFLDKCKDETFHAAQELRIPFAPIPTTEDLINCSQLKSREWFATAEHPRAGPVAYPGAPFKMSQTPWSIRHTAPLLGQHNEKIYSRLGYSRDDLVRMKEQGIV